MARGRETEATDDGRRTALLDAAAVTFMRHGFRKTSMDEVARDAGISRQGLYLHFPTKEDLFRAAVAHLVGRSLDAVLAALAEDRPLAQRLVAAFDAWTGRFVGNVGAGASDLGEATGALTGPLLAEHDAKVVDAITRAIRGAELPARYDLPGVGARQIAETLHATSRGLKYQCATRDEFIKRMTVAVRLACAPLIEDDRRR